MSQTSCEAISCGLGKRLRNLPAEHAPKEHVGQKEKEKEGKGKSDKKKKEKHDKVKKSKKHKHKKEKKKKAPCASSREVSNGLQLSGSSSMAASLF